MHKKLCPRCGSSDIEVYEDLGLVKCHKCGYDALEKEPLPYDPQKSAKAKKLFDRYKTEGSVQKK